MPIRTVTGYIEETGPTTHSLRVGGYEIPIHISTSIPRNTVRIEGVDADGVRHTVTLINIADQQGEQTDLTFMQEPPGHD